MVGFTSSRSGGGGGGGAVAVGAVLALRSVVHSSLGMKAAAAAGAAAPASAQRLPSPREVAEMRPAGCADGAVLASL